MTESSLSAPIAAYLRELGYSVRAEIAHCDLIAVRGNEIVAVELKRSLNLTVLAQAARRQQMADRVYIGVARPRQSMRSARWRGVLQLLRRLEMGLLYVDLRLSPPRVEAALEPAHHALKRKSKARQAVLQEVENRSLDLNVGGSSRRKLMTGYRENALRIAFLLERHGPLSAKRLRELGTDAKTWSTLHRNVYGWFAVHTRGVYGLTESGDAALALYPELLALWAEGMPPSG